MPSTKTKPDLEGQTEQNVGIQKDPPKTAAQLNPGDESAVFTLRTEQQGLGH